MQATRVSPNAAYLPRAPFPALERIAVFRALQLGDMLVSVPALRALRRKFPDAHITLIGLPWAREFADRFRCYVDDFLPFPGGCGLPERDASSAEIAEFHTKARRAQFDLAVQLHGNGRYTNPIVRDLGARSSAGFYAIEDGCPDPEQYIEYPTNTPEVHRLLQLLDFLGAPLQGDALEFPISNDEWRAAAELRNAFGLRPGRYVCVHVGSRNATRRWLPDRFAHIADRLAGKGLQVVLTGIAEEADITRAVAKSMMASRVDLTGQTTLGVAAAMLTGARLLVSNDTGISHIAAALRVPSVIVYLGSSPERWAPLDSNLHRRVMMESVECRPCQGNVCPVGHKCAVGVSVEDVWGEVELVLSGK